MSDPKTERPTKEDSGRRRALDLLGDLASNPKVWGWILAGATALLSAYGAHQELMGTLRSSNTQLSRENQALKEQVADLGQQLGAIRELLAGRADFGERIADLEGRQRALESTVTELRTELRFTQRETERMWLQSSKRGPRDEEDQ